MFPVVFGRQRSPRKLEITLEFRRERLPTGQSNYSVGAVVQKPIDFTSITKIPVVQEVTDEILVQREIIVVGHYAVDQRVVSLVGQLLDAILQSFDIGPPVVRLRMATPEKSVRAVIASVRAFSWFCIVFKKGEQPFAPTGSFAFYLFHLLCFVAFLIVLGHP